VEAVDNKQESSSNIVGSAIDEIVLVTGGGVVASSRSENALCNSIRVTISRQSVVAFAAAAMGDLT
jgi:hypothetical protein